MFRSIFLGLLAPFIIASPVPSQESQSVLSRSADLTKDDVFQRIWDSDENQLSVSRRTKTGEWEDPEADILLDEQVKASGERAIDLATRPLFHKVNESKLFDPNRTYASFMELLDNYAIRTVDSEFTTEEEETEQQYFLSQILQTRPMQIARNYINQTLGENLSEAQFYQVLHRLWFELYTNRGTIDFCSGFEHVFVGEGKYQLQQDNKREIFGDVSGYHSWVKFYLDEKNERVNFRGYNYDSQGTTNPNMVTLQMIYTVMDTLGEPVAKLFKRKSGFFVGSSPECEMAMATVVFFESVHGKISDSRRITINGATYNLVLYRSTNSDGNRGDFIRSFYPIFLGLDDVEKSSIDSPIDEVMK